MAKMLRPGSTSPPPPAVKTGPRRARERVEAAAAGASQGVLWPSTSSRCPSRSSRSSLFNGPLGWIGGKHRPESLAAMDLLPPPGPRLSWACRRRLHKVARSIGFKTVLNEFVAYAEMSEDPNGVREARLIASFALWWLRNFLVHRHPDRRHRRPAPPAQTTSRARILGASPGPRDVHERHDRRHLMGSRKEHAAEAESRRRMAARTIAHLRSSESSSARALAISPTSSRRRLVSYRDIRASGPSVVGHAGSSSGRCSACRPSFCRAGCTSTRDTRCPPSSSRRASSASSAAAA